MKEKLVYTCNVCAAIYPKWIGKCESCNSWNTIEEDFTFSKKKISENKKSDVSFISLANNIEILDPKRISTTVPDIDQVFGGGLVVGSVTLVAGEPGIGKSTFLIDICSKISKQNVVCLYISGEESVSQIYLRTKRLGINNVESLFLLNSINLTEIISAIKKLQKGSIVVIDSIQTIYHDEIPSAPGTVNQVRNCAFELIKICKKYDIALLLVGHVTKDGQIAGPKVLEHMVDAVLCFENENSNQVRILRAVKNRFGASNEIAIMNMTEFGLEVIKNPSSLFLPEHAIEISGSSIFAGMEGTRPLLVEVQALAVPSYLASPRRTTIGCDQGRVAMLIALLNTRLGINLLNQEVYVNIAGGLKIIEPALDLSILASLISVHMNKPIPRDSCFFGEVGLSGEIRRSTSSQKRIQEATKLGFKKIIMPYDKDEEKSDISKLMMKHISELLIFIRK